MEESSLSRHLERDVIETCDTLGAQTTATVIAASAADPAKTTAAVVTLVPLTMTISPSSANLNPGQSQTFSATVQKNSNTAVTWSTSPQVGTINGSGVYTAPAVLLDQRSITVTATSVSDPTPSSDSGSLPFWKSASVHIGWMWTLLLP